MQSMPLILTVDDQDKNNELIEALLVPLGYKVIEAKSGEQALKKLAENPVDLILLDVMMSDINGFEVTRRIRQKNEYLQLPIILITALRNTEDRVRGIEAGCDDFLSKPFEKTELLARVKSLLKLRSYYDLIEDRNRQLLELNREKNQFISIMAHDLTNIFTNIIGSSEILLNDSKNAVSKENLKMIEVLHNSSQNGYRLLQSLLSWSLMTRESVKVKPVFFQVKKISEEIGILFESHFSAKNIAFEIIVADEQGFGDKEMIKTVLRNLVANAIKFTPRNGTILITAESEQGTTKVSVEDSGVGMSSKAIQQLFKIETKFSTKGTENESGTGLGLILCKEIVEKNQGTIAVDSTEGKGCTFTFTLPSTGKSSGH